MNPLDGRALSEFGQLRCSKNEKHVLGVLERVRVKVEVSGSSFTYWSPRLLLFRQTVDTESSIPEEVDVVGVVEGRTIFDMVWRCSVPGCGGVKKWHPERGLLELFVRTYLAE